MSHITAFRGGNFGGNYKFSGGGAGCAKTVHDYLLLGSWQLAVGSWQLTVDSWQLTVGSWQLAVDYLLFPTTND
ncbi:hypothetical protein [Microcoleus sp. A003_D6]|uniref:hypothetical protein n=1 Tax=Microcoleus sp. A003_D6 TaxID=3055266 RepID=UPI002FD43AE2